MDRAVAALGNKVQLYLTTLTTNGRFASGAEARFVLDTEVVFRRERDRWVALIRQRWQAALLAGQQTAIFISQPV